MASLDVQSLSLKQGSPEFGDIPYQINHEKYVGSRLGDSVKAELPTGFPSRVQSSMTWTTGDLTRLAQQWLVQLSQIEADSIEEAINAFIESKTQLQQISQETFILPQSLSQKLDQISETCHNGVGFCILRGLRVVPRTEEESAVLFAGISAYVGPQRGFQDIDRKHVLDIANIRVNMFHLATATNLWQAFHTDDGDIVALYYSTTTEQGGRTQLVSQSTVYNELTATRPDLIEVLADDWFIDTYYRPESRARQLPLLYRHGENGVTIQYTRLPFSGYKGSRQRNADIAPLTPIQIEALDVLQLLSEKHSFSAPTQPGDILYFNNVGLFHGREPYVESSSREAVPTEMNRHVLRLWLQDPKRTAPLAAPLQKIWDEIYGLNTEHGREETWNVNATASFAMNADKNG
ncbi:hypothetical protein EG329_002620 [Mollisiaceae sp. DMI_Dod_QoI]|nr:hypothetical protein EG329_002620 [Helotiales sp. DMI_Dod_QoI]